jgi:hypothetical protein
MPAADRNQERAMNWKARLQDVLDDLERERDELKLKLHLARAEGRDELARMEEKLAELRFRAGAAGTEARDAMDGINEAASRLADEIRDGFARVRKTL